MLDKDLVAELRAMNVILSDLRDKVEDWRTHVGSSSDFALQVLSEVKNVLTRIDEKLLGAVE
jgi:hypothetical protein